MKREDITNDEQAKQYFRDMVNNDTTFKDNHERATHPINGVLKLQHDYEFKRIIGGSVQEAINHALGIQAELKRQANERT